MHSETCPTCQRLFVPLNQHCPDHCSLSCCRRSKKPKCQFIPLYTPRLGIVSPSRPLRCRVCWTPLSYFVPFPSGSIRLDHFPGPEYPPIQIFRHPSSGLYYLLNAVRPRIHVLYCSLRCYCDSSYGHYARTRGGKILRQHRYNDKHGHMPRELRRWWKEEKARMSRQIARDLKHAEEEKAHPIMEN